MPKIFVMCKGAIALHESCVPPGTDKTHSALAAGTVLSWWFTIKLSKQKDLKDAGDLSKTEKKTHWTRKLPHIKIQAIFVFFFNFKKFKVSLPVILKLLNNNNNNKKVAILVFNYDRIITELLSKWAGYHARHFNLIQQSYEVKIFHPTDEKPELRVSTEQSRNPKTRVCWDSIQGTSDSKTWNIWCSTYSLHQELTSPHYNDGIVPTWSRSALEPKALY